MTGRGVAGRRPSGGRVALAPLGEDLVEAAAALVAAEQAEARRGQPGLPVAFTEPATCAAALRRLLGAGHTGVVATEAGRPVAVLTGAVYGEVAHLPAEGFAVATDRDDPTTVLAIAYAELATGWIAAGVRRHVIDHPALPRLGAALHDLRFGRLGLFATQPVAPRGATGGGARVRIGGEADLDVIADLAMEEIRFRSAPPIFTPPDRRSRDQVAEEQKALRDAGAVHLLATVDGRDVGLLTIELSSPAPRLCAEGQPYIGPTAIRPGARGRGIGRALVDAALTWAHEASYPWISVDFEPSNPLSRPFWFGNGFTPAGARAVRVIDPAYRPLT